MLSTLCYIQYAFDILFPLMQIKTSNGVFNSSAAVVPVILWPLAPAPEVVESSITSLVVRVPLTSQHTDIEMIALQVGCCIQDNVP